MHKLGSLFSILTELEEGKYPSSIKKLLLAIKLNDLGLLDYNNDTDLPDFINSETAEKIHQDLEAFDLHMLKLDSPNLKIQVNLFLADSTDSIEKLNAEIDELCELFPKKPQNEDSNKSYLPTVLAGAFTLFGAAVAATTFWAGISRD